MLRHDYKDKFKDSQNRWRTKSLFWNIALTPKEHVLFTFEEARILFLETNDPTGYRFAVDHLGGWKHFLLIKQSPVIGDKIAEWEEELEIKLRSESVRNMMKLSQGDKGYQANKFLIDGGWIQKKAGRPTKEAIKKNHKMQQNMYAELEGSVDLKKH